MSRNIEKLNTPSHRIFLNENWAYIWPKAKFNAPIFEEGEAVIYGGFIFRRRDTSNWNLLTYSFSFSFPHFIITSSNK